MQFLYFEWSMYLPTTLQIREALYRIIQKVDWWRKSIYEESWLTMKVDDKKGWYTEKVDWGKKVIKEQ